MEEVSDAINSKVTVKTCMDDVMIKTKQIEQVSVFLIFCALSYFVFFALGEMYGGKPPLDFWK